MTATAAAANEESSRFIIIPSNTPSNTSSTPNKTSHFKVQLEKPLEIDAEQWEVALLEINYPYSWGEVINSKDCIYRIGTLENNERIREHWENYKYLDKWEKYKYFDSQFWGFTGWNACNKVIVNVYYSIKEMLAFLNDARPNGFKGDFSIGSEELVLLRLKTNDIIEMKSYLAELLGFDRTVYSYLDGDQVGEGNDTYMVTAERKPDKRAGMYNMFIYCNLVNEMLVGNRMVKLLRTLAVNPNQAGEYVTQVFHPLRYMKLSSSFFQEIEILITDDLGEPVKFLWGKCIVHLHLRRKKSTKIT